MENFDISRFMKIRSAILSRYNVMIESAAKKFGISKPEADILILTYYNSDCVSISELQQNSGFSQNYLVEVCGLLAEHGLISLNPDSTFTITGKGGIIAKSLSGYLKKFYDSAICGISPEETAQLNNIFNRILNNLK